MDYKPFIDIFSALLTPVIAIITTYIAIQQYRTNKLKFRHELYDKRIAIFKGTVNLLAHILREGDVGIEQLYNFNADTSESYFLFDKDVHDYLWDLYLKGVDLHQLNEEIEGASDERRRELSQKDSELLKWFGQQVEASREKFARYLSIKSLK